MTATGDRGLRQRVVVSTVSMPSTHAVPLKEAADKLGVGVTTARRWVRSGRLKGHQVRSREGTVWLVELPATQAMDTTETETSPPVETAGTTLPPLAEATETAETVRLAKAEEAVTRLEAHVADLRHTVARLETELDARRHEGQVFLALLSRMQPAPVLAMEAPTTSVEETPQPSTETVEGTTDVETAETTSGRSGWWHRLGRWLAGS
jgi:excisionase family DNA binding protein